MKEKFPRYLQVLTDLPQKTEEIIKVPMTAAQEDLYFQLVSDYKERARRVRTYFDILDVNLHAARIARTCH